MRFFLSGCQFLRIFGDKCFFMQATLHLILTFQEFLWFELIMENIIVSIQICPEFKALLHQSAASLGIDKDCG